MANTYKYNYIGGLIERLMNIADKPLQVELQPGINCGPLMCQYCYGKDQKANRGMVTIDEYKTLLSELKGKVQFLALGGITTDPMTYPMFSELLECVVENGYKFGVSTKGLFMTEKSIEVLSSRPNEDCFINFSIDASNSNTYNSLRRVKKEEDHFKQVHEIVSNLKKACDRRACKLRIKASYLIFEENAKEEDFDLFVNMFRDLVSEIRFSIPQVPNVAQPVGYLDATKAKSIRAALQDKFVDDEKIVVLNFDQSDHDKSFDKCWAQRFNLVVDKAGYVYPCPQVATSNYSNLIIGNIKDQSIWDIWHSEERKRLFDADVDGEMKCRVCDRKDEAINVDLNKILGCNKR